MKEIYDHGTWSHFPHPFFSTPDVHLFHFCAMNPLVCPDDEMNRNKPFPLFLKMIVLCPQSQPSSCPLARSRHPWAHGAQHPSELSLDRRNPSVCDDRHLCVTSQLQTQHSPLACICVASVSSLWMWQLVLCLKLKLREGKSQKAKLLCTDRAGDETRGERERGRVSE